jgi:hypothetical protein
MKRGFRAPFLFFAALGLVAAGAGPASAVAGGTDVPDGALPFVARLSIGDTARACTGALVHPQLVLTAGACIADSAGVVRAGAPPLPTTATVGRANVAGGTGGVVSAVREVVPHPDRDLALLTLETPVTTIAPIPVAAAAPAPGDELTLAGFGRTVSEWVPGRLKSATFTVDTVAGSTVDVVPAGAAKAGVCKGDAGGPAFRITGGAAELVAVHHASNQAGCLGEADGQPRATETRVDDVRSWIAGRFPGFSTGFDAGEARPHWQNAVDDAGAGSGGLLNVGGVCCALTGPELFIGTDSRAHSGDKVLLYSGKDNDATRSYAYTKAFNLRNVQVRPGSVLSYWVYPQSKANSYQYADGLNSTCVAVDLVMADGSTLRDSGLLDQHGNRAHPANQCGKLTLDTWNEVVVPIGTRLAGKQIATLTIGYDQGPNTGGYRGFVDDVRVTDVIAADRFHSGVDPGQPGPTWTNSVSTGAPRGGLLNVGGVCCGLTGPELFVGTDSRAHSGDKVLLYSGRDNDATRSYAYTRAFAPSDVFVTPTTTLSYWVYPQSKANSYQYADGANSTCVAVDLILRGHDGTEKTLRDSGALDTRGNRAHPANQCGKLTLDRWNHVSVPLGAVANGQQITQIDIGYDQSPATGGYRGFVDDIRITH